MGSRAAWKDKQHPLRHHPSLQLTGIPTLVHWSHGAPAGKLGPELEAAGSAEEADGLIKEFISQHPADRTAPMHAAGGQAGLDVQALMQQLQSGLQDDRR